MIEELLDNMDASLKAGEYTNKYLILREIKERLSKTITRQKQLEDRMKIRRTEIKDMKNEITATRADIEKLNEMKDSHGKSVLEVQGKIMPRTVVNSSNATLIIDKEYSKVQIQGDTKLEISNL